MPAGRPVGSKNGTTASAKAAIQECFEMLGGVEALKTWAEANPTDFYKSVWVKILPLTLGGDKDNPLIISEIRRTIIDTRPSNSEDS